MFEQIQPVAPDAILGLTEAFEADPNPHKINLGVGVYRDDHGRTPVLETVREAERRLLVEETTKNYLPISGSPEYAAHVQALVFGEGHDLTKNGRARTLQTPGGTAGLCVGADLIARFARVARVWLPAPTWPNHNGIFSNARFDVVLYPYYDPGRQRVNIEAMCDTLSRVPAGEVVLLHVSCQNPTGADLEKDEWARVAAIARERRWLPFLDFAYQGFARGIDEDREGVLAFAKAAPEMLLSSSYSKNFGLYRERTGALTLVMPDRAAAENALAHAKQIVRVLYSNPPAHGALIVRTILGDKELRARWVEEVAGMRGRIASVRRALVKGLHDRRVARDFSFIEHEYGMFSLTGLSDEQVRCLREKKSIYVVGGGRINVAGITSDRLDYLCDSLAEVLK